jgi:hypothetical protein
MSVTAPPPPLEGLDAGVIEEARRRQRRRRVSVAASTLVAAFVGLGAFLLASGGGTTTRAVARSRPPEPLPRLTGPALAGPTHLRIVADGNYGPPFVLDVDRGTIRSVHGLGVPPAGTTLTLWSPRVEGLTPAPGGALAGVYRQACQRCARSQTEFLIGADGSARHVATLRMPRKPTEETTPALGSTATWLLRWPHTGPCTLRRVPGTRPAVRVPCGDLGPDTEAGLMFATGSGEAIVNPLTGRIRYLTAQPHDAIYPLHGDLALEITFRQWDAFTGGHDGHLSVVNMTSGTLRPLAWPSYFGDVIRVVPEPHGPLVAVDFGSPAYPGPAQAEDIWMLNTTTGQFTHLPAYPAQVDIKFSSVAWTDDDRLVIVAQGGGRTVLGIWKPGQTALPLRIVPANHGYWSSVPLVG